jgi:hypothetical protein
MKNFASEILQKLAFTLCCILITGLSAMAQDGSRAISGTVKDEAGGPLSGVTVNAKGSTVASTSDAEGNPCV